MSQLLLDAGFSRREDNWLSRKRRKDISLEVVRECEKDPSKLADLIEEPVPPGLFYLYRLDFFKSTRYFGQFRFLLTCKTWLSRFAS